MTVGERIKERRIELGLSQEEVALKAGYKSRSSINKIEKSRDLPLPKVEKVSKILNCTPTYLLGWEDDVSQMKTDIIAIIATDDLLMKCNEKMVLLDNDKKEKVLEFINDISKKVED